MVGPSHAKRSHIRFIADEGWVNPAKTKHVVEALRHRKDPHFVARSRPFCAPPTTPYAKALKTGAVSTLLSDQSWKQERNWLITCLALDRNPLDVAAQLDWVGRILRFGLEHEAKEFARRAETTEPRNIELWFSFPDDNEKQLFLQKVRDDGYRDPEDEIMGFHAPTSLTVVPELLDASEVFELDEYARIHPALQQVDVNELFKRRLDRFLGVHQTVRQRR